MLIQHSEYHMYPIFSKRDLITKIVIGFNGDFRLTFSVSAEFSQSLRRFCLRHITLLCYRIFFLNACVCLYFSGPVAAMLGGTNTRVQLGCKIGSKGNLNWFTVILAPGALKWISSCEKILVTFVALFAYKDGQYPKNVEKCHDQQTEPRTQFDELSYLGNRRFIFI